MLQEPEGLSGSSISAFLVTQSVEGKDLQVAVPIIQGQAYSSCKLAANAVLHGLTWYMSPSIRKTIPPSETGALGAHIVMCMRSRSGSRSSCAGTVLQLEH